MSDSSSSKLVVQGLKWPLLALFMSFTLASCASWQANQDADRAAPEAATGFTEQQGATATRYMVAAATEAATDAGVEMLAKGGTAIDAAIAVQAMLTLTEPQSSGIGGGAFILYWDNQAKRLYTIDAREKAPFNATPELFLREDGTPERWIDAVVGGRSVGVPGVLAGLKLAHDKWGQRPWSEAFQTTIAKAEQGFEVSPRLAKLVALEINPGLRKMPVASDYFFPNGEPLKAGTVKRNPALAETLRTIAAEGIDPFYQGELARSMVAAVQNSPIAPGLLSMKDLAEYQPQLREPVCTPYREMSVCGMGPPSSGGIAVNQILGILNQFELADLPVNSPAAIHLFAQASRLAFADRNQYVADSDFVDVPVAELLAADYLAARAKLIQPTDMGQAQPGNMPVARVASQSLEQPNTSHMAIVDSYGNAISMTTSIEMGFGSTVMVNGYLLNNQLTDFSLSPTVNGQLVANRVQPGKRPRSSMAPAMVFAPNGDLRHVVGSPGGTRIINYVAQTIVGLIDWDLSMQAAIDLPRIANLNGATFIENLETSEFDPEAVAAALRERGHEVRVTDLNSGLHGITLGEDGQLHGGADPRREGRAKGR